MIEVISNQHKAKDMSPYNEIWDCIG